MVARNEAGYTERQVRMQRQHGAGTPTQRAVATERGKAERMRGPRREEWATLYALVDAHRARHAATGRWRASIAARWQQVHAAERAGHPMRHPREFVFGASGQMRRKAARRRK